MTSTSYSQITEDRVREALRTDKGKNAKLICWNVQDFTKKGDNFVSIVTSVLVKYSLHGEQQDKVTYVVKLGPDRWVGFQEFARVLFMKEVHFYKDLAQLLSKELISIGENALRVPLYFFSSLETGSEIVFLEDLRVRGFRMRDRISGTDPAHIKLMLKELARLHASSLLLLRRRRSDEDLTDKLEFLDIDYPNFSKNAKDFTEDLFKWPILTCEALLQSVSGYKIAEDWIDKQKGRAYDILKEQLKRAAPFDVICHGDCWNNNVLFRYNDDGEPVEVMLLDLQLCRRASPCTDITYLMYSGISHRIRRDNLQDFLSCYYETFCSVMKAGGEAIPFTFQELQQEYKRKLLYGFLFSMITTPHALATRDEVPVTDQDETFGKDFLDKSLELIKTNSLVRTQFEAIINDMIEAGVIS